MARIKDIVDKILATICVTLFAVLTATVFWQVLTRYAFNKPSAISEELGKILFVWLVLLSAAYLFGEKGGHMNIGIIEEKVNNHIRFALGLITQICIFGFAGFILLNGGFSAVLNGLSQANAAIPIISTGQIYMALPISGALILFYSFTFILADVKHLKKIISK
ncbi:hypothetical protein AN639_02765 [Candidatus Epulonipiscium fishelsonii]|uniref:Uncharacterized protein n=1 Tax=Candidatus Epulonipiscium fishelsonii TaxID=77094 RepID=A0ACC8X990_9FIRM|nr:hypothetical protein AN396_10120 [Epulopiscium sp. SCG-B11WGA-EpuloA1]ONI41864.1 hypothetical protein AN639_02765 [Epulopiscium sp. SCG-B05WGA-EpuloA1]ONI47068.1 hypothetical protein AN644_01765 [Epulopiscium sp. SCG-C06WGA-EpuloA1]